MGICGGGNAMLTVGMFKCRHAIAYLAMDGGNPEASKHTGRVLLLVQGDGIMTWIRTLFL